MVQSGYHRRLPGSWDRPYHLGKREISQPLLEYIVSLRKSTSMGFKIVSIVLKKGPEKNLFITEIYKHLKNRRNSIINPRYLNLISLIINIMSIPSRTFNQELSRHTQFPSLVHTDDLYFRRCMLALVCVLCLSARSLVILLDACKRSK